MKTKYLLTALIGLVPLASAAAENEVGLLLNAGVEHKINKKWNIGFDAEMRTRNDFRTMDRVSVGLDASYKICSFLKADAAYTLLIDNNIEKISYEADGELSKWRPSYWGTRQRFSVSLTGSLNLGRFTFSLRERWQYTYRPERDIDRYDFIDGRWETNTLATTHKHVLRSRLKVDFDIPRCKIGPYASVEIFNGWELKETRVMVGAAWKLNKKNSVGLCYRLELPNGSSDPNRHFVGANYSFKF